ncbi:hypothetical protein CYMTET_21899 [Cymbomonas tetramitiformis]|uniref:Uncharacterized protein n=1 Tax=Cymbomonas tetramitiformis TaxID=36881 RepID=A0AAE0L2G3_9CHLO|nr:hypothetical protein CYMTET_21899 [Cymbomonas tetramitiformis]
MEVGAWSEAVLALGAGHATAATSQNSTRRAWADPSSLGGRQHSIPPPRGGASCPPPPMRCRARLGSLPWTLELLWCDRCAHARVAPLSLGSRGYLPDGQLTLTHDIARISASQFGPLKNPFSSHRYMSTYEMEQMMSTGYLYQDPLSPDSPPPTFTSYDSNVLAERCPSDSSQLYSPRIPPHRPMWHRDPPSDIIHSENSFPDPERDDVATYYDFHFRASADPVATPRGSPRTHRASPERYADRSSSCPPVLQRLKLPQLRGLIPKPEALRSMDVKLLVEAQATIQKRFPDISVSGQLTPLQGLADVQPTEVASEGALRQRSTPRGSPLNPRQWKSPLELDEDQEELRGPEKKITFSPDGPQQGSKLVLRRAVTQMLKPETSEDMGSVAKRLLGQVDRKPVEFKMPSVGRNSIMRAQDMHLLAGGDTAVGGEEKLDFDLEELTEIDGEEQLSDDLAELPQIASLSRLGVFAL